MTYTIAPESKPRNDFAVSSPEPGGLLWVWPVLGVLLIFANLGGPALFDPDEGRNAEKAREILVLGDWITPHENFLPVLDKPIFFYWLIAVAYKVFGISEWSARLPSALAALACLGVVYGFARSIHGVWVARWSTLILLSSMGFFFLARIVLLDMTLTFCTTVALVGFYSALGRQDHRASLPWSVLMYTALAIGTLIKGLAGVFIPGMIAVFYLLVTKKWRLLRGLYVVQGAAIYVLLVAPWYLWVAAENPGYLRYFFWEEHFSRYWTTEFNRAQSWYYYFVVLAIGCIPWTPLLPLMVKRLWRERDDGDLFLLLWVALPFIFFTASSSKLPHYLLPIFPPLAILAAQTVVAAFSGGHLKPGGLFSVWALCVLLLGYLALGTAVPALIPWRICDAVQQSWFAIYVGTVLMLFIYGSFLWCFRDRRRTHQSRAFISTGLTLSVLFLVLLQVQDFFSVTRSAKTLAESIAPFVDETRLVLYHTYPTGLMFYLRPNRPAWVVATGKHSLVMDNPYLEHEGAALVSRFGKVLLTQEEFSALWSTADAPLRVLVRERHVRQFHRQVGRTTKLLAQTGEYLLLARQ